MAVLRPHLNPHPSSDTNGPTGACDIEAELLKQAVAAVGGNNMTFGQSLLSSCSGVTKGKAGCVSRWISFVIALMIRGTRPGNVSIVLPSHSLSDEGT